MLLLYHIWRDRTHWRCLIYIPLCFYFIAWDRGTSATITSFTFHYASTLSGRAADSGYMSSNLHSTMLLLYRWGRCYSIKRTDWFTFHYASTLSPLPDPVVRKGQYLHSTMLLLYQDWEGAEKTAYFYLHSTMLLLYLSASGDITVGDPHLHSTMLLLYRKCRPRLP